MSPPQNIEIPKPFLFIDADCCHFISFIIIIWVEKSWNYYYYSTEWINEWRNELWKMLSCRIFHLTLNCSMWRDECRQFIIFLLLFFTLFSLLAPFLEFPQIFIYPFTKKFIFHVYTSCHTHKKKSRKNKKQVEATASWWWMSSKGGNEWMNERQNLIEWMNKNYENFYSNKMWCK